MNQQNPSEESGNTTGQENEAKRAWPDPLNGPQPDEQYDSGRPQEGQTPGDRETDREPESGDKVNEGEASEDKPEQDFDVDESTGGSAL